VRGRGRPLRFLALVMLGWIGARIALLWPQGGPLPGAVKAIVPVAPAEPPVAAGPARAAPLPPPGAAVAARVSFASGRALPPAAAPGSLRAADPLRVQIALLGLVQYGAAEPYRVAEAQARPTGAERIEPLPARWSASAWIALRPGQGLGAAPGAGQLGGSQAGVRAAYMLLPRQRLAAFARFAAPIGARGRELSLGLEWQPTRVPVRAVAEQRFALDGGGSGPALGVIAGVDAALGQGFRLESYGQAGAIRRRRLEPYADGAARATRLVMQEGRVRLALGVGAWGAAQRDAARLDLGPSATLALPVAGTMLRFALDWRQRVAGDARPGSGPALTLGSDF